MVCANCHKSPREDSGVHEFGKIDVCVYAPDGDEQGRVPNGVNSVNSIVCVCALNETTSKQP
jgi:hypothetical protein